MLSELLVALGLAELPVLILIVMEHALGVLVHKESAMVQHSLNPYCNGTCSRSS